MFGEVFKFELRQQLARPVFWLVALAFALLSFFEMTGPGVALLGVHGGVLRSAPLVIANGLALMGVLAVLAVGAFSAAAALRDEDARTADVMGSLPISQRALRGGRCAAVFVLALAVLLACAVAMAAGSALPGAFGAAPVGIDWHAYVWAFAVVVLPATLFVSALLFVLATATRSLLATYVGVIVLLFLLLTAHVLMGGVHSQVLAALVDPFGAHTLQYVARYWTAAETNARLVPLTGIVAASRIGWTLAGVALVAVLLTVDWSHRGERRAYARTRGGSLLTRLPDIESNVGDGRGEHRGVAHAASTAKTQAIGVTARPACTPQHGWPAHWRQCAHLFAFDARRVLTGTPFRVVLVLALLVVLLNLGSRPTIYGVGTLPTTWTMLSAIADNMTWLLGITVIFYAGDLVWRDHDVRIARVIDAAPWPTWIAVVAKVATLWLAVAVFLACGGLLGVIWQLAHGYTHLQPSLYAGALALTWVRYALLAALCLVVQVVCGSRIVGYVLTALWLVVVKFAPIAFGPLDHLYWYGTTPQVLYSGFNGFGRFLAGALWFDAYWTALALALLVVATLFWPRGTVAPLRLRARDAVRSCRAPVAAGLSVALAAFVALGAWAFYNTHVLNRPDSPQQIAQERAHYEKTYAHYRNLPQPRIAAAKLDIAIHPSAHMLAVSGTYTLVNRTAASIDTLLVWYPAGFRLQAADFAPHAIVSHDAAPNFVVYHLQQPLQPGATLRFAFHLRLAVHGFANEPRDTFLVANGSFFDNVLDADGDDHNVLPHIGYQPYLQLSNAAERRKFGLPPASSSLASLDAPNARAQNGLAGDAGRVRFDVTLSTAAGQTAITSGRLERTWLQGNRRYFHYVTQQPIASALPIMSARYSVHHSTADGIAIDVYEPAGEGGNVARTERAARDALAYYSTHYGPYPFQTLRFVVVPYNYTLGAEAFPGVVAVRETSVAGPLTQPPRPGGIDPLYGTLAHEVSHEWWLYQELPANARGANFITESLAQYSELMVLKQRYGATHMTPVLRQLLDTYLAMRHRAPTPESPLMSVGGADQGYIYYDKGALAMYALQDYVGEATVDRALRQFLAATRGHGAPYPLSTDFLATLEQVAGPQSQPLIDDLFRTMTTFDDRMLSATAQPVGDGKYRVTLRVHAAMYRADGAGAETRTQLNIPLEIGVFGKPAKGGGKLGTPLYLAQYPVKPGDSTVSVTVVGKPYMAGIDPYNELVDANPDDNRARVAIR